MVTRQAQIHRTLVSLLLGIPWVLSLTPTYVLADWPPLGKYEFSAWSGPKLNVYFSVPPQANKHSAIVMIMPGAKRNAEEYRNEWDHLATANGFISLVVEASLEKFPSEYEYNLGGTINAAGKLQPEESWLLSALDLIFNDFTARYGSERKNYSLYGHSAGGGFAHLYPLFKPDSKAVRIVAANPAFLTMPNYEQDFPFALRNAPLPDSALKKWLSQRLVILLGDRDRDPRTHPLSNGPQAQIQGPHVFARSLGFYQAALCESFAQDLPLNWQIEIVAGVGHSNAQMASHAVKYLVGE
ncbi:MAG: hypothetical protein SH868_02435 [Bythopirellula sp.]|nr:hypothetical protein [Bythopirellula sp.]